MLHTPYTLTPGEVKHTDCLSQHKGQSEHGFSKCASHLFLGWRAESVRLCRGSLWTTLPVGSAITRVAWWEHKLPTPGKRCDAQRTSPEQCIRHVPCLQMQLEQCSFGRPFVITSCGGRPDLPVTTCKYAAVCLNARRKSNEQKSKPA